MTELPRIGTRRRDNAVSQLQCGQEFWFLLPDTVNVHGDIGSVFYVREDGIAIAHEVDTKTGKFVEQPLGLHATGTRTVAGRCLGGVRYPIVSAPIEPPALAGVSGVTGS